MAMTSPRLGISYTDGGARTRQVHQLHGSDSRVTEVLFDALDRGIATTRVAPGSFGKGSRSTTMQPRSTFVDVPAFLASLGSSWKMSGDVADYYAGQGDGPLPRSNDQGYPYRGTRYEDSSRKRPLEGGAPGLAYAIHDVDTLGPDQRSTARMRYGANTGADPLPPGKYYVRDAIRQAGTRPDSCAIRWTARWPPSSVTRKVTTQARLRYRWLTPTLRGAPVPPPR